MIVSHNTRGLSSRIKCYLSAKRIDNDAVMMWTPGPLGVAPFNSIFTNKIIVQERGKIEKLRSTWHWWVSPLDRASGVKLGKCKRGHDTIDFMFRDTPSSALRDYSSLIKTLDPISHIKKEVKNFLTQMPKTTFSIRSWKETKDRQQYFEYQKIVDK
ncbi:unnamed protein product, partial [marine sediment metagenome]